VWVREGIKVGYRIAIAPRGYDHEELVAQVPAYISEDLRVGDRLSSGCSSAPS
jgi:hypothetical protein